MKEVKNFLKEIRTEIRVKVFYWDNFNFCYFGTLKLEKELNTLQTWEAAIM